LVGAVSGEDFFGMIGKQDQRINDERLGGVLSDASYDDCK
jgi:hypothetical protein